MRSDVIELGLEVTEGSLLGSHVGSGWPGGTAFEHEVHVLVLSVLLGAGRLDEIGHDPELNEPDRESREAAECVGGEGRTVVCANPLGQPELTKEAREYWDDAVDADVDAPAAVEQKTRVHVLDGERIAVPSVSGAELTLEVGAPASVGHVGRGIGSARVPTPGSLPSLGHEIVATQNVVDRGARGQDELGPVPVEVPADLLRTVVREGTTDPKDSLDDLGRCRPGAVLGSTRPVPKSLRAVSSPTVQPHVAGLAANPVVFAQVKLCRLRCASSMKRVRSSTISVSVNGIGHLLWGCRLLPMSLYLLVYHVCLPEGEQRT